jgi:hypothetical protein
MRIPADTQICRINRNTGGGVPAYTQICRPIYFDVLCRNREAGLPDLHGSLVRHMCPGYGQRSYPGYISQLRCHIPTIKEENIQAWKQSMEAGCTVEGYLPSLCTSTSLPHKGKVTVREVQGTGIWHPIESNQGQSQGSLPLSPAPIWSVACVSWLRVTVVTLATTI